MKKLFLTLSILAATILSAAAQSPESIRKEFTGNLPLIQQNLPRKIADGVSWKSIEYKPDRKMVVLTYVYDNIDSPLDPETAQQYYASNLNTLRDTYKNAADPLVRYAVDGEMTLRFSYVSSGGRQIATLDYPASTIKD